MGEGERAGKKGDRSSPQVGRSSHLRGWWSRQFTGQFISSEKSGSFCCIVLYMSTCAGHLLQKLVKKCKIANKKRNFSNSHLQSKIRIRLSCDLEQNQIQVLKLFPFKEYDTGFKDLTRCMMLTISDNWSSRREKLGRTIPNAGSPSQSVFWRRS